ncbi:unnamed protein product [Heligmosomoides polygyrus]|uniref:Tr-type G domain-containing protein n=1 Tax=Heligmosomoides polygyrus TaxID=6339 RepID=A0A183GDD9_HELPZ|nr:unnamed protein product [Heligmosomoides polygyrus]
MTQQGGKILYLAVNKVDQFASATTASSDALKRMDTLEKLLKEHREEVNAKLDTGDRIRDPANHTHAETDHGENGSHRRKGEENWDECETIAATKQNEYETNTMATKEDEAIAATTADELATTTDTKRSRKESQNTIAPHSNEWLDVLNIGSSRTRVRGDPGGERMAEVDPYVGTGVIDLKRGNMANLGSAQFYITEMLIL